MIAYDCTGVKKSLLLAKAQQRVPLHVADKHPEAVWDVVRSAADPDDIILLICASASARTRNSLVLTRREPE